MKEIKLNLSNMLIEINIKINKGESLDIANTENLQYLKNLVSLIDTFKKKRFDVIDFIEPLSELSDDDRMKFFYMIQGVQLVKNKPA